MKKKEQKKISKALKLGLKYIQALVELKKVQAQARSKPNFASGGNIGYQFKSSDLSREQLESLKHFKVREPLIIYDVKGYDGIVFKYGCFDKYFKRLRIQQDAVKKRALNFYK